MTGQATGQSERRTTVVLSLRVLPDHRERMKLLAESNFRTLTQEVQLAIARHLEAASDGKAA